MTVFYLDQSVPYGSESTISRVRYRWRDLPRSVDGPVLSLFSHCCLTSAVRFKAPMMLENAASRRLGIVYLYRGEVPMWDGSV